MRPPRSERGAALLTVLLLVAVVSVLAATALERLRLSTRLAGNAAAVAQGTAGRRRLRLGWGRAVGAALAWARDPGT